MMKICFLELFLFSFFRLYIFPSDPAIPVGPDHRDHGMQPSKLDMSLVLLSMDSEQIIILIKHFGLNVWLNDSPKKQPS